MDRMTPPPNYYGAPFPGFNQGPQGPQGAQPPMPTPNNVPPQNNMPNQNLNNPTPPPYTGQVESMNTDYKQNSDNNQLCVCYTYADIAHANRGKVVKIYCSFPDSSKWHDVVIEGIIYYAADDHIVIESIEEPKKYTMILGVYVNYMETYEKPIVPMSKKNN